MDYALLGARIRQARTLHGWTQDQLAEKANISLSFLGHIERGTRKPSLETLVTLASILEVSFDSLLSDNLTTKFKGDNMHVNTKKQVVLKEIMRIVEEALDTWTDEP